MTRRLAPLALALLAGCTVAVEQPPSGDFGHYEGTFDFRWLDEDRRMELLSPVAYVGPDGVRWEAPQGFVTDGASIPRVLFSVANGPFDGPYRKAAVIHDAACISRDRPWEAVHRAYYTASRAAGTDRVTAKLHFWAVHRFGPRWSSDGRPVMRSAVPPTDAELDAVRRRIEATDPGLAELETMEVR